MAIEQVPERHERGEHHLERGDSPDRRGQLDLGVLESELLLGVLEGALQGRRWEMASMICWGDSSVSVLTMKSSLETPLGSRLIMERSSRPGRVRYGMPVVPPSSEPFAP